MTTVYVLWRKLDDCMLVDGVYDSEEEAKRRAGAKPGDGWDHLRTLGMSYLNDSDDECRAAIGCYVVGKPGTASEEEAA